MSQPVELNPEGLRVAAGEFDGVADMTKKLLETLKNVSGSEGEPWGDDKAGHKFADGDKGYLANRDGSFTSLSNLVQTFQDNATNLRDAAKTFEDNERKAAGNG